LYHHFVDLPDLVEQAVAFRRTRRLRESLVEVRSVLDSADTADAWNDVAVRASRALLFDD
jgi:hypothetical protein